MRIYKWVVLHMLLSAHLPFAVFMRCTHVCWTVLIGQWLTESVIIVAFPFGLVTWNKCSWYINKLNSGIQLTNQKTMYWYWKEGKTAPAFQNRDNFCLFKWIYALITHATKFIELHPWAKNVCFSSLRNPCCYQSSFSPRICSIRCRSNKLCVCVSVYIW